MPALQAGIARKRKNLNLKRQEVFLMENACLPARQGRWKMANGRRKM